jgi:Uma2 family endonuclease
MRAQIRQDTQYTVADYLQWPDDIRCELIDGIIYDMSPAPVIEHQRLSSVLHFALFRALEDRKGGSDGGCGDCQLFTAPIDVVLGPDTVVQPDLIVVCDSEKLANGRYVDGAPDLVVEILSPSTALKDKREKRNLYERVGVAEYLIVDPAEFYVEQYRLKANGEYGLPDLLGSRDVLTFALIPGWSKPLSELLGWPEVEHDLDRLSRKQPLDFS